MCVKGTSHLSSPKFRPTILAGNPVSNVRFGLIGFGLFGAHHGKAIAGAAGAELAAIAVRSAASQEAAKAEYPQATIYGDYRELAARSDLDVINIVAPNSLHYETALAALSAGKSILLEKPMALRVEHCDQLLEVAKQQGKIIAVNHELRHSSLWGGVKQLIEEDAIGKPQAALIELSRFPYRQGSDGWRWDPERVGNWILEEPIHFFDLARWYLEPCGDPISVYAQATSRHPDRPELKDNFTATVNHANGGYAVVYQTLAAFGHHVAAKITGEKGTIWAKWSAADARSDSPQFSLRYGLGDEIHEVEFTKSTGELLELQDQIAMMVDCVNQGKSPICSGVDGRWSTKLCLAAQESVDSGGIVEL